MTAVISPLTQRSAWKALAAHYAAHKDVHLRQLFANRIAPELESKVPPKLNHDSSTNTLIECYRRLKGGA